MMESLVQAVVASGGPMAVGLLTGLGIGLTLWRSERKSNQHMTDRVLELAEAQVESNTENKALLQSMKEVITQVVQRL